MRLFQDMIERKVTVNPRASAVVITNSPKHVQVNQNGIEKLKDEVSVKTNTYVHRISIKFCLRW